MNFDNADILIIDAAFKKLTNTAYIDYLKTCTGLGIYVTDTRLKNFLMTKGLNVIAVYKDNYQTKDYVHVEYKHESIRIKRKNI